MNSEIKQYMLMLHTSWEKDYHQYQNILTNYISALIVQHPDMYELYCKSTTNYKLQIVPPKLQHVSLNWLHVQEIK